MQHKWAMWSKKKIFAQKNDSIESQSILTSTAGFFFIFFLSNEWPKNGGTIASQMLHLNLYFWD